MAAAASNPSPRKGRKRGADDLTMSVWQLGNKMRNAKKGKNLMQNLPTKCTTTKEANEYLGLCALLELHSPLPKNVKKYYDKKLVKLIFLLCLIFVSNLLLLNFYVCIVNNLFFDSFCLLCVNASGHTCFVK